MATGRLSAVWKDNCVLCWVLFFMSGLCWLLSCSVIIQHGLSCRANAAWDYSASPLKPETRDAGECARNVLIALCEECPSADSSSDFISGVWDWYFRRGRGRAREGEGDRTSKQRREKLRCTGELGVWVFWYSLGLSVKISANTTVPAHKCNMEAVNPEEITTGPSVCGGCSQN